MFSANTAEPIDQAAAIAHRKLAAKDFRDQLAAGIPTGADEEGLRRLASQIESGKLIIKLFLRHPLHAKLYLAFRKDALTPIFGYLGSSNFTLAGLSGQGELNVDVMEQDACGKLQKWFEDRWSDRFCVDISRELVEIINSSWARPDLIPPYHIYIKTAWHLSHEARAGLAEFRIPGDLESALLDFQKAAVKIAARHLNRRGGVVLGDVVGLGKTLMATALARIFEDDHGFETLILCPRNLVKMWEDHAHRGRLRAKVMSVTQAERELPDLRRYRIVVIDESHNLRNRDGVRYRAIADYIENNARHVILLSATPYNKSYLDLASQLRLFMDAEKDIGVRPEKLLREIGEIEFIRKYQCPVRSLAAFEKSGHADDWRDLMRLCLVRRTRGFIQENYADTDMASGRKYLEFPDGRRSYFAARVPKTVKFAVSGNDSKDQYAKLFSDDMVDAINSLELPRYGLGNYIDSSPEKPPTEGEAKTLANLSRAGVRMMGFCRTGLFKRLESGGHAFLLSIERHIIRNFICLHAIENGLQIPIGAPDALPTASWADDRDVDLWDSGAYSEDGGMAESASASQGIVSEKEMKALAAGIYEIYASRLAHRFHWIRPDLFSGSLAKDLRKDIKRLMAALKAVGPWDAGRDAKLQALVALLTRDHPKEKVLVFSQFADTVDYLAARLKASGVKAVEGVTGFSPDPTEAAWRFSPASNGKRDSYRPEDELRVVLATDVLSEGQNLQDCSIIVNYDLPWAIIPLIQRAGRVDRIGQEAESILCYSFLPADGVERILNLRSRVRQRLKDNAEVVGTDEAFFEDQGDDRIIHDLFTERPGVLDGADDADVDMASHAYQIWKNAIDRNPGLEKTIREMPDVVYSTRPHRPAFDRPEGALVYLRTAEGTDALAWVDRKGKIVNESQLSILKAMECDPDTPALERHGNHHEMVEAGAKVIMEAEKSAGGQLGRPTGARFKTYERLMAHATKVKGSLFDRPELHRTIEEQYKYPLLHSAADSLNRQLRSGVADHALADMAMALRADGHLCRVDADGVDAEPQLICSMGLRDPDGKEES